MKANNVKFVCANCGSTDIDVLANANRVIVANHTSQVPTANGIPASVMAILDKYSGVLPAEMVAELMNLPTAKGNKNGIEEVVAQIDEGGHIESPVIVRRWVNAQLFKLLERDYEKPHSLHRAIKARGWNYAWKVVLEDWKIIYRMYEDNECAKEDIEWRLRFYSFDVIARMMEDYIKALRDHLEGFVKSGKMKTCKGREYVPFYCDWNRYKGLFVDEINAYVRSFERVMDAFKSGLGFFDKFSHLKVFANHVKLNRWNPDCESDAFLNAFKAVGGYYTLKDLILFEGVRPGDMSKEACLRNLDRITLAQLGEKGEHTWENGYVILGTLKSAIGEDKKQQERFVRDRSNKWHQAYLERCNQRRLNR